MIETILTRKSIRKYLDKPVDEKSIKECISAAMAAPSAGNEQPWHFIIVNDREVLKKLQEETQPYAPFLPDLSAAIVVCADKKLEKFKDFWVIDCAAAVQNMLLALHSKGLGSIWLGLYPMEERVEAAKKILELPGDIIPHSIVPVGYPEEIPENNHTYMADRVHYNKF